MRAQQLLTQLSPVEKSICSAALCLYGAVLRRCHLFVSVPSPLFLTNVAELIINAGRIVRLPGASAAWTVWTVWTVCVRVSPCVRMSLVAICLLSNLFCAAPERTEQLP